MRFRDTLPELGKEKHMQVFEKLTEYRYEQLVFCHDKATGTPPRKTPSWTYYAWRGG